MDELREARGHHVMGNVLAVWDEKQREGWTLQMLGERMGYDAKSAKKSAWQFLRSNDPRVSMVIKFAEATETTFEHLMCAVAP